MNFLGIAQKSEFYKFYSTIIVNNMYSDHEYQELIPILDPQFEINSKIEFAWNTWLMPKRYIAMTTLEGEGGYFYDKDTGAVADYENGNLEDLIQGNVKILNDSIFDFMRNFLS